MKKIISFVALIILLAFINLWLPAVESESNIIFSSEDPQEFFGEMQSYFKKAKRSDADAVLAQFMTNFETGVISQEQLEQVIMVANEMMNKRMRTYPHFTRYFQSINSMTGSDVASTKFKQWNDIVKEIVANSGKGKYGDFQTFMDFSVDFMEGTFLNKKKGMAWSVLDANDFNFLHQNNNPSVKFTNITLHCTGPKDSIDIYNTSGEFFPFETKWTGQNGKVTWEKSSLNPQKVYATFKDYSINMKRNEYTIKDAELYHNKYFKQAIKGTLTDRVTSPINDEYSFPVFYSDDTNLALDNIAPQTKYRGGFGIEGSKILAYGTEEKPAELLFYDENKRLVLTSRSKKYGIKEGREVNANNTAVSLYFTGDSIFHPRVNLHYGFGEERELRLATDGKASSKIAFMSSYHQLEANVEAIFWKMNTPILDFKMVSQRKGQKVIFESFNLYEPNKLEKYRIHSRNDPVTMLAGYGEPGDQVHIEDFAKYINPNYNATTIMGTIFEMVEDGYIYYNPDTDIITIREKTKNYIASSKGEIDYDRIALISESKNENAQLDIETKELVVTGVKAIQLSDSQKVTIYPQRGIVRVHKNRDMEVDGTVLAGNVDFTGRGFSFDYDRFAIDLDSIGEMQIYLEDPEGKHETIDGKLAPVRTVIQNVTGKLLIDQSGNKSGLKNYEYYPKFESTGNAFFVL